MNKIKMNKSKLGVVIADGVGYRNFVMSDFIKHASKEYEEVIIYSGLIESIYSELKFDNVTIRELDIYKERKISWFFRKLKEVGHLKKHMSFFGIKDSYETIKPKKIKSVTSFLNHVVFFITKIFYSEKHIKFFEVLQYKSFRKSSTFKKYISFLEEDLPDHLFFTHQRPYNIAPLLGAAKKMNISTSSFIFSWDNLASKGRMLGEFDGYLTWSQLMKDELKYFYPNSSSKSIKIVGTPQFEPYILERYDVNKEEFYKRFSLNIEKKIIYYSCGDVSTSKLDPLYIETIAKAIEENLILNVNFIVRTSPAEDETRFIEIKNKFPFIIWNFPDWNLTREYHNEAWSQRVPSFKDVVDLRALLTFSDVNINMCSTMGLDIMLFDKPVINSVFGNKKNRLYNDQKYLNYIHYDKVVKSGAVVVAKTEKALIDSIVNALEHPEKLSKKRKELLNLQIGAPLKGTSKRIVEAIKSISLEEYNI